MISLADPYSGAVTVPKVSVGIPTYNRAWTLREAIQSVLNQTFHDLELIISDNTSTDNTQELVKSFDDSRIRYIRNKENIGMIANFNQCLRLFTGSYCAFLGSDDYWLPDFLENLTKVLDRNPDVAIAFSNHYFLERGQLTPRKRLVKPGLHEECIPMVLKINPVCLAAALIRKTTLDKIGEFRSEVFNGDFDLYLRIANSGHKMYYVDELLAVYQLHEENESRNWQKTGESMIAVLTNVSFQSRKNERLRCKKLASFYRRLGVAVFSPPFNLSELRKARSAFKQSICIRPLSILGWGGLLFTYFPRTYYPVISWIRRMKGQLLRVLYLRRKWSRK